MTCEQAAQAEMALEEGMQGVESNVYETEDESRPCPRCHISIYRIDGCNEIKCGVTSCKYIFCWGCGEASHGHEFNTTTTCNQKSVKRWNEKLAKRRQELIEFKKNQLLKPSEDVGFYFDFNEVQKRALLISLLI